MKRFAAITVLTLLLIGQAALGIPVKLSDGFDIRTGKVGMKADKMEFRSVGGTGVTTLKFANSINTNQTVTMPDPGASASFVMTAGTQTIAGVKTFSSPPTITGGLTAANIQTGSVKRQRQTVRLAPTVGAVTDTTVSRGMLYFGRAGTIKQIMYGTVLDPVSGTNLIKAEKATFGGTTLLSTASVSLNGTTAAVGVVAGLSVGAGVLDLTATQAICLTYDAGTQGTDAEQVTVTVEFEPTDF